MEWEKIFANHIFHKMLISKICKKLKEPKKKNNNNNNPIKNCRGPEYTFFQRRHTDGPQVLKKMFNIINNQ